MEETDILKCLKKKKLQEYEIIIVRLRSLSLVLNEM